MSNGNGDHSLSRNATLHRSGLPDAEFLSVPSQEFIVAPGLALGKPDPSAWWNADRKALEEAGLLVVMGGGGMAEREPHYIVARLAEVLAGRGPFHHVPDAEEIDPHALLPLAESIFSSVSIPVANSPIKGETLANLLALAGSIDFQTVHLTHVGGREIILALLTAAGCRIVFGVADGLSYALRNGLSYYLLRLMGVPESFAIEHAKKEQRRAKSKKSG